MHHYLVGTRDYDETKISKINSLQMLHVTVFKFYFDNKKMKGSNLFYIIMKLKYITYNNMQVV